MTPRDAALAFVDAINSHAPDRLAVLMTADHVFIDSDGARTQGKTEILEGWRRYFTLVPDYRISVEEIFVQDPTVVLLGEAKGTFVHAGRLEPDNHWRVPAAWRVVVNAGQVSVWQLFVNPEPMAAIFKRLRGE